MRTKNVIKKKKTTCPYGERLRIQSVGVYYGNKLCRTRLLQKEGQLETNHIPTL